MLRQREIHGLFNQGVSQKNICTTVHCSKRDVSEVSKAARDTGKSYGELLSLSDSELLIVLDPQSSAPAEDPRKMELEAMMSDIIRRLKSKHETMQFVHETFYKMLCPDRYGYTQSSSICRSIVSHTTTLITMTMSQENRCRLTLPETLSI